MSGNRLDKPNEEINLVKKTDLEDSTLEQIYNFPDFSFKNAAKVKINRWMSKNNHDIKQPDLGDSSAKLVNKTEIQTEYQNKINAANRKYQYEIQTMTINFPDDDEDVYDPDYSRINDDMQLNKNTPFVAKILSYKSNMSNSIKQTKNDSTLNDMGTSSTYLTASCLHNESVVTKKKRVEFAPGPSLMNKTDQDTNKTRPDLLDSISIVNASQRFNDLEKVSKSTVLSPIPESMSELTTPRFSPPVIPQHRSALAMAPPPPPPPVSFTQSQTLSEELFTTKKSVKYKFVYFFNIYKHF